MTITVNVSGYYAVEKYTQALSSLGRHVRGKVRGGAHSLLVSHQERANVYNAARKAGIRIRTFTVGKNAVQVERI